MNGFLNMCVGRLSFFFFYFFFVVCCTQSSLLLYFYQTNPIVTSLTACTVLYTRSAGVAYFAAGAVACSIAVKLVKRLIRQPRPVHPTSRKKTYGCVFSLALCSDSGLFENLDLDPPTLSHMRLDYAFWALLFFIIQHAKHTFRSHHALRGVHPTRRAVSALAPVAPAVAALDAPPTLTHCGTVGDGDRPFAYVAKTSYVAAVHCGLCVWGCVGSGLVRVVD